MTEAIFDIHSHILPGIDDGAKNWEMAVSMLRMSWDAGVRAVIATPHFLPWRQKYDTSGIPKLCEEAGRRLKEECGIEMPVYPGQEIYYFSEILDYLEDGKIIPLAGSRYVLVEFSEEAPFSLIKEAVGRFRRSPYRLIIAHCERYAALRDPKHLSYALENGARLQSNAEEMMKGPFSRTKHWLSKRYANQEILFLGSDMHNDTDRPPITEAALQWFRKHLDEADPYRKQLFWENAVSMTGHDM